MKPIDLDEIPKVLELLNIEWEYINIHKNSGFSRTIQFKIYGQIYQIEWYANNSTIKIGENDRSPFYKFRYIFIDRDYPLVEKNLSLCFSYNTEKFMGEYRGTYDSFRIPVEIK